MTQPTFALVRTLKLVMRGGCSLKAPIARVSEQLIAARGRKFANAFQIVHAVGCRPRASTVVSAYRVRRPGLCQTPKAGNQSQGTALLRGTNCYPSKSFADPDA